MGARKFRLSSLANISTFGWKYEKPNCQKMHEADESAFSPIKAGAAFYAAGPIAIAGKIQKAPNPGLRQHDAGGLR